MDNHQPALKNRILKNREEYRTNIKNEIVIRSRFRERIEDKFAEIVNRKQEMAVSKIRMRTNKSSGRY